MRLIPGDPRRHLFFTGKGGVGKTSIATATAVELADAGRRVLLVSTDPASNLDEVLGAALGPRPVAVPGAPGLHAMNIDPEASARAYRERVVGPMRGRLPEATLRSIEEQLSGACTVEIAAFDEFARLLGDAAATAEFDHVVFDTAPTGHTLRLLQLPSAWSGFLDASAGSASCLGPLAGLEKQRSLYADTVAALSDPRSTAVVLVARPDASSLGEAERTRRELVSLGLRGLRLVVNGVFSATDRSDAIAVAIEDRGREALARMPADLAALPRSETPLHRGAIVGIDSVRAFLRGDVGATPADTSPPPAAFDGIGRLIDDLAAAGHGAVLTVGKGGVGKTSVARAIALGLAERGLPVHLTTTDPAGHDARDDAPLPATLRTGRIDADAETRAYAAEVIAAAGADLDEDARALLEEDLRSPCTQEIAVFRAFARTVAEGAGGFVVIDTAPTGHTLLLLDAAEAYHREIARTQGPLPDSVRSLLPRLRDPGFTRVVVVTLPEATPVHEAAALQRELRRAGIEPFAWVVNQSLATIAVTDPVLAARKSAERRFLDEVRRLAPHAFAVPFAVSRTGAETARA
jgi:arsenite-transporting ATPase